MSFLTFFYLFIIPLSLLAETNEEKRVIAVTHIHSLISPHGSVAMPAIGSLASKKGIHVLIPTDHFLYRWEYGLPPFPGVLRRTVQRSSVYRFGPQRYLNLLSRIEKDQPGLTVIPGLEVSPAYYWEGHYLKGNLTLREPQRHLLVLGLRDEDVIKKLPVLSNPSAGTINTRRLLPSIFIIAIGLALLIRWPAALFLVLAGLLWLVNERPFRQLQTDDPFSRNGYETAQRLIDYVQSHGGLTVWAHPEATNFKEPQKIFRSIFTQTLPYPEALLETQNYTGFALYWEGVKTVGIPGGTWDQALQQFAKGERATAPWAFAELDWSGQGNLGLQLEKCRNVLLTPDASAENVLNTFRQGRFYPTIQENKHEMTLDVWQAHAGKTTAESGQTILWQKDAALRLRVISQGDAQEGPHHMAVQIIRNGVVWKEAGGNLVDVRIPLPSPENPRDYYRVMIKEEGHSYISSNPLFIQRP